MGGKTMSRSRTQQKYNGEFKQKVIETMHEEKLSIREVLKQFEIGDHNAVARWERIYLTEGPKGLYVERRGRGSKGRPPQMPKKVEEDLLSEVQRLRAENAYLKKLQALVLKEERQARRRK